MAEVDEMHCKRAAFGFSAASRSWCHTYRERKMVLNISASLYRTYFTAAEGV